MLPKLMLTVDGDESQAGEDTDLDDDEGSEYAHHGTKEKGEQQSNHEGGDTVQHRALVEEREVIGCVDGHIARVVELDALVFGARKNFFDSEMAGLRVDILYGVPEFWVGSERLGGVRAHSIHLDHDGTEARVFAEDAPHEHGLCQVGSSQFEEFLLAFGEVFLKLEDLNAVRRAYGQLGIQEGIDLVYEGDLVFERTRERGEPLHHLEIPEAVRGTRGFVEDIGDFVVAEIRPVLLVAERTGIVRIEVGLVTIVRAYAPGEIEESSHEEGREADHHPARVEGPSRDDRDDCEGLVESSQEVLGISILVRHVAASRVRRRALVRRFGRRVPDSNYRCIVKWLLRVSNAVPRASISVRNRLSGVLRRLEQGNPFKELRHHAMDRIGYSGPNGARRDRHRRE
jgi:hypothetical protein